MHAQVVQEACKADGTFSQIPDSVFTSMIHRLAKAAAANARPEDGTLGWADFLQLTRPWCLASEGDEELSLVSPCVRLLANKSCEELVRLAFR